jgi:hypothetical protein
MPARFLGPVAGGDEVAEVEEGLAQREGDLSREPGERCR